MTVHAIVRRSGRQYRVSPGQRVHLDRADLKPGEEIAIGEVLLVSDDKGVSVGTPVLEGAKVFGKVVGEVKSKKTRSFRFHRRARVRRIRGHRQKYTVVEVTRIEGR